MRTTDDTFEPRRDGWYEHSGVWGEVTVGTVLAGPKRTERWEVIATAHPSQVEYGHTLCFRIREQTTGEEHTVFPKLVTAGVKILTQDPRDRHTAPPTEPTDTEAIQILITELGAELLATRDDITGEITCPNYAIGENHLDEIGNGALRRGLAEHLRFAHNLNPPETEDIAGLVTVHGQSHNPNHPHIGKAGFPHRHVPEDLSLITGR